MEDTGPHVAPRLPSTSVSCVLTPTSSPPHDLRGLKRQMVRFQNGYTKKNALTDLEFSVIFDLGVE